MTLPVTEYDHHEGRCAVTGGYRYRGARSPMLGEELAVAVFAECGEAKVRLREDARRPAGVFRRQAPNRAGAPVGVEVRPFGTVYAIYGPDTPRARRHAVGH